MNIFRVTEKVISNNTMNNLQYSMQKLQNLQSQLSSGRQIQKPSDDPSGAVSAMGLRASQKRTEQYSRNASDGLGWLGTADTTLTSALESISKIRQLVLSGANGTADSSSRNAIAQEIKTAREGLIGLANTTYLNRPIFAGTAAPNAQTPPVPTYDASGNYNGNDGTVMRTVGPGATVQVNFDGPSVWGDPAVDTLWKSLDDIQAHLESGDQADVNKLTNAYNNGTAMESDLDRLDKLTQNIQNRLSEIGARYHRVEAMQTRADDSMLTIQTNLSNIENIDLPKTIVDLQLQQTAYQAALAATAKVIQPSLVDFLG
jgi:flagellar hook-associated protein 3 FlgL